MTNSYLDSSRLTVWIAAALCLALAVLSLFCGAAYAQEAGTEITPSFGDGKLKLLGAGFKPNEKVTIAVKIDSGTYTFNATADAQGAFELDTGLDLAPGSSVELDARGDQGSGGASITSVPPALPLPQTGAATSSQVMPLLAGMLLVLGGIFFLARSPKR